MAQRFFKMNKEILPPFSSVGKSLLPGSIYEHYKGQRYKIIGLSRHSETLEELVIYEALYGSHDIWARPLPMFIGTITLDGIPRPRFLKIDP